jgi:protein involved in polysaccharide export with SLBB domain
MRAVKLFAVFCLTIFINIAALSSIARAQENPSKDSTEKQASPPPQPAKNENDSRTQAAVSPAAQTERGSEERYRIGFQDTLEITVAGHPKYSLTTSIAPNGTIRLNNIEQPVVAVCKTEQELSEEIKARYMEKILRNPFVVVRVAKRLSQSVSVIGAVKKPDNIFLDRRVRLLEALSYAGGPDSERAGTKMIVARLGSNSACRSENDALTAEAATTAAAAAVSTTAGKTEKDDLIVYQFNIKDVLEGKENLWLQPGDVVSVLDFDVVYVYGNVIEQGSVKLNRPLTLRQAIAEAKGFKPASKKDKIRILRLENGSAEWKEFPYDLKEIDSGKVQDPFLQPNDIVAVSEDQVKSILNGLRDIVKGGAPTLFYRVP